MSDKNLGSGLPDDADFDQLLSASGDLTPVIRPERRADMLHALLVENARLAAARTDVIEATDVRPIAGLQPRNAVLLNLWTKKLLRKQILDVIAEFFVFFFDVLSVLVYFLEWKMMSFRDRFFEQANLAVIRKGFDPLVGVRLVGEHERLLL